MRFPSFKSQIELRAWLQSQSTEVRKEYGRAVLIRRKEEKNLIYSPSQVEIRSLPDFPSIKFYDAVLGGYTQLCAEFGLINKYLYKFRPFSENRVYNQTLIIDSREKKALSFGGHIKTKIEGLKYGDYALEGDNKVVLERKSLPDLIGTVTQNYDRFRRELDRAADSSLFVLVESDIETSLNFDKKDWIRRFNKIKPTFVWHQIRTIIQDYPNTQFLFVGGGRTEVARIALKLLYNGEYLKSYDLQWLFDQSIL